MALSSSGITAGASPISAAQNIQYFNALTGVMTDQPITIKNTLSVGGGDEATSANKLTLNGVASQTGYMLRVLLAIGDANPTFAFDKTGKMSWGPGSGTPVDTTLERVAATILGANGPVRLAEVATPDAPGAGYGLVYFKADDLAYIRAGAAGAEAQLLTAGSAATDPILAQVWT